MHQKYNHMLTTKKRLIHITFNIFLLFLLLTLTPTTPVQAAKKVSLSTKNIILVKGQKKTIKIKNTKLRPVWSSKNKKVATVKRKGSYGASITAKKKGTTYIYAKVYGKKYKCKVRVETPVLKTTSATLKIGESIAIKISGTKQKISYKSSDSKIATVDKNGTVTAVATGNATVTLKLSSGKKYTCSVVVTDSSSSTAATEDDPSTPNTDTTTPGDNTTSPGDNTSTPGDNTTTPGDDTSTPGGSTSTPGQDTTMPSDDTADAGEYSIGQVHTGYGTYYEGGYVNGCANLDDIANSYYVAAINKIDYREGNLAGAYLKVTGPSGKTINVLITDTLEDGEGQKGDIDLNINAFEQIEPLITGKMKVTWEIIPLPTDQPIQYVFKPESTEYWMQVQVRNHRYPVKKLEIMDASGQYKELPREEYNFFTLDNPGKGPYTFRVTDIYGHILIDKNVPLSINSAVNGAANFPY